jgi:hypothetical protein
VKTTGTWLEEGAAEEALPADEDPATDDEGAAVDVPAPEPAVEEGNVPELLSDATRLEPGVADDEEPTAPLSEVPPVVDEAAEEGPNLEDVSATDMLLVPVDVPVLVAAADELRPWLLLDGPRELGGRLLVPPDDDTVLLDRCAVEEDTPPLDGCADVAPVDAEVAAPPELEPVPLDVHTLSSHVLEGGQSALLEHRKFSGLHADNRHTVTSAAFLMLMVTPLMNPSPRGPRPPPQDHHLPPTPPAPATPPVPRHHPLRR